MQSNKTIQDFLGFHALVTGENALNRLRATNDYKNRHPEIVDKNVFVGMEVEVEEIHTGSNVIGLNADGRVSLWKNTEDGSLRNNGREFVSIPVRGDNIPFALDSLKEFLTKNPACKEHQFTPRTSVHVHVDVRDLNVEQVTNIMLLYIAMEPLLYNFCGGNRHKNIFCVPLNQTNLEEYIHSVVGYGDGSEEEKIRVFDYYSRWKKYTGFNMKPIRDIGTVEFRHMVGTIDVDKLVIWVNLLLKLRKFAESNSLSYIKETILNLNTNSEYIQLVNRIFGDYSNILLAVNSVETLMEDMVIFIKDCLSDIVITKQFSKDIKEGAYKETQLFLNALANKTIISHQKKGKSARPAEAILPVEWEFRGQVQGIQREIDNEVMRVAADEARRRPRPRIMIAEQVQQNIAAIADELDF